MRGCHPAHRPQFYFFFFAFATFLTATFGCGAVASIRRSTASSLGDDLAITDLLDAIAAVSWATSQLSTLEERISAWVQGEPYSVLIDIVSEPAKKLYRLVDIKPIDPIINAEAGVIIHSIQSSLDLLACATRRTQRLPRVEKYAFPHLDKRHGVSQP